MGKEKIEKLPKTTKKEVKPKKSKDVTEHYDNSVSMSFSMNNLTEKDVNKVIETFDKIQKDFRNNISQYYIKTSSNITKQKGKTLNDRDFGIH